MSDNNTNTSAFDWSRFVQRVNINADRKKIYRAWSTPAGIEQWFLRKAIFVGDNGKSRGAEQSVQKNDNYEWYWHGWDDSMVEKGTILEANGSDLFKFSFGKAGTVTVTIKTEQNETILELLQKNIPVDDPSKAYFHVGCTKGWVFYLANLKSILEGGIDLRNKNVELKNMVNA